MAYAPGGAKGLSKLPEHSPADRSLVGVASLVGSRSRSSMDRPRRLIEGPFSGEDGKSSTLLLRLDVGEMLETFAVSLPVGELGSGSRVRISSHSVLSRPSTWPLSVPGDRDKSC